MITIINCTVVLLFLLLLTSRRTLLTASVLMDIVIIVNKLDACMMEPLTEIKMDDTFSLPPLYKNVAK